MIFCIWRGKRGKRGERGKRGKRGWGDKEKLKTPNS
jgi:hypothetical protein